MTTSTRGGASPASPHESGIGAASEGAADALTRPLARFWRGGYSLALSFWVIAPLVVAAAFALPEAVGWAVRRQEFNPFLILAAIVAIWGIVVVAQVYLTVGLWRSAARTSG